MENRANQIFWTSSSSGWVVIVVRTFNMALYTTFNLIIWAQKWFLYSKNRKIKFLGRGVLRDEFLQMWELSGWHSKHFLILSYGPKLHSWLFVFKKPGKSNFWHEEFFGMRYYTCQNFQLFILYNYQFDHMVLKRLPTVLTSILDFLKHSVPFLYWFWLFWWFVSFLKI